VFFILFGAPSVRRQFQLVTRRWKWKWRWRRFNRRPQRSLTKLHFNYFCYFIAQLSDRRSSHLLSRAPDNCA